MNLSPQWAPALENRGWCAVHWSEVGDNILPDHVESTVIAALNLR